MLHLNSGQTSIRGGFEMGKEASIIECKQEKKDLDKQAKGNAERDLSEDGEELRFLGVRAVIANPVSACEKIDKMFGTGGEAIIHYMWFETGHSLFDDMIEFNPEKSQDELLQVLVSVQPRTGWGELRMRIMQTQPPLVHIIVKNPLVKTVKGSQKQMIGSFWAGVLTRHFSCPLLCKNFVYDSEKDELSCTITV